MSESIPLPPGVPRDAGTLGLAALIKNSATNELVSQALSLQKAPEWIRTLGLVREDLVRAELVNRRSHVIPEEHQP